MTPPLAPAASGSVLDVYSAFLRASFLKLLAYRLRYFTGILSYLVYVTTYYFLWKAVYAHASADGAIGDFRLAELLTYVVVGWLGRSFYFNNVDREIADLVEDGQISLALARPVSFQGMMVAGAVGESLFRLLFFSLPIGAVLALVYPVQAPASALHLAAFLVSLVGSLLVLVHLNFLVGISALKLKSIQGVIRAKHYLLELLSGLLIPVSLFPGWLQEASPWLPFQYISYLPSTIYLGRVEGVDLWRALCVQLLWAVFLALLSAFLWTRATRRLTVQGG